MTRGCDHVVEREGGRNNKNIESGKKNNNKPNCMGTGEAAGEADGP